MRQTTLMLATMAFMMACGPTGNTPWDENRDGLTTACEGLNPTACDSTPGCEPTPVVCIQLCRDDGHGGCLPCGGETCRPTAPPTFACSQLPATQCLADLRCELLSSGHGTEAGRPGAPDLASPMPPVAPMCVPRTTASCESRDVNTCTLDGRCVLEAGAVCEVACAPGVDCPPCATPFVRCVAGPPTDLCGARDVNTCTHDGRCVLEGDAVCEVACAPGVDCPPCATPSLRCVPIAPDHCGSRDLVSCGVDGRCAVQAWACPTICMPDGDGGCLPCDAPPAACVPVTAPSRCEGLDRATCSAVGCAVVELACDLACRDGGDGGCLPCDEFICIDGSSVDGGPAPSQGP